MDKRKKIASLVLVAFGLIFIGIGVWVSNQSNENKDGTDDESLRNEILGGLTKEHQRHFKLVDESELSEDESQYVNIIKKVPGIHRSGDLFMFVGHKGKDHLTYFEDVLKENVLTIYIKREEAQSEDDPYYVIVRLIENKEFDFEYIEVPSMKSLDLATSPLEQKGETEKEGSDTNENSLKKEAQSSVKDEIPNNEEMVIETPEGLGEPLEIIVPPEDR